MISLTSMQSMIACEMRLKKLYGTKFETATNISPVLSGMPHGSNVSSKVESGAVAMVEIYEAYREMLESLGSMRQELNELISSLDNDDDIAIMRYRYIFGYSPKMIPNKVKLSLRSVFYHLSHAEKTLIRLYPERVME